MNTVTDVGFHEVGASVDDSHAGVLEKEGEESAGHDDHCCCVFVSELAETLVGEHELSMVHKLCVLNDSANSAVLKGLCVRTEDFTWTNPVEMITPVPNCFRMMNTLTWASILKNRVRRMGVTTALV